RDTLAQLLQLVFERLDMLAEIARGLFQNCQVGFALVGEMKLRAFVLATAYATRLLEELSFQSNHSRLVDHSAGVRHAIQHQRLSAGIRESFREGGIEVDQIVGEIDYTGPVG